MGLAILMLLAEPGAPRGPVARSRPDQTASTGANANEALARLPLTFVPNRGQAAPRARFLVQGGRDAVAFTDRGLTLSLGGQGERYVLNVVFSGARPTRPRGEDQTDGVVSYLTGAHPRVAIPTFHRVRYAGLWPGVDLLFSSSPGALKYNLELAPGADPSAIGFSWSGATGLSLTPAGALQVETPLRTLTDLAPVSRQGGARVATSYRLNGKTAAFDLGPYDRSRPIVIDPAILLHAGFLGGSGADDGFGIAVDATGAAYVTGQAESTQTTFPDGDPDSNDTMPAPGFDQTHNGGTHDAFVAKVTADGTTLVYATYLGGLGDEAGNGIAVDALGAAFVTGATASDQNTFPDGDPNSNDTMPAPGFDQTYNGGIGDAFVAKLTPEGTGLAYATYLGGSAPDQGNEIRVDGAGAAYVSGYTGSDQTTFPDGGAFDGIPGFDQTYNAGSYDAFVAKLTPEGTGLAYATYLGGSATDQGIGIAVDDTGAASVTGYTVSNEATFPDGTDTGGNGDAFDGIPGFDQTYNGNPFDAFVAKLTPDGTGLSHATYLGGSGVDYGQAIAVDGSGAAYVSGYTGSDQATFPDGDPNNDDAFPVPGFDQTINFGGDAFAAKLSPAGTGLSYATYLGGFETDQGTGIALDPGGAAYVTGLTGSGPATFPDGTDTGGNGDAFDGIPGFDQTYNGGSYDAFVAKLTGPGTALAYATYLGGSGTDIATGIAVDVAGAAVLTGHTESDETTFPDGDPDANDIMPVPGFDQTYNGGTSAAFVAKFQTDEMCKGKAVTRLGTPLADDLIGTSGADVIKAGDGADTVHGEEGKDRACGGNGNDDLFGQGSNDILLGQDGKDDLKGGSGEDLCVGGPGKDSATGCETKKSI